MTETPQVEHPVTALQRELVRAQERTNFWCLAAVFMGTVSLFMLAGFGLAAYLGAQVSEELAGYRERCIDTDTAMLLTSTTQRVSKTNDLCLESHRRNEAALRKALPGLFLDDRIPPNGLFAEGGKKNDRKPRKAKRKKVPKVRFGKGGGGVLPGKKPK